MRKVHRISYKPIRVLLVLQEQMMELKINQVFVRTDNCTIISIILNGGAGFRSIWRKEDGGHFNLGFLRIVISWMYT